MSMGFASVVSEVPGDAWEALRRADPPAVLLDDGGVLAAAGKWAIGKREHGYSHLEVAGLDPREAVRRGLAELVLEAVGDEVESVLAGADASWDGEWGVKVKRSYVAVYRVRPGVPVKVRCGSTYYTSRGRPEGRARTYFYGGVSSPQAYAAAVRRLQAALLPKREAGAGGARAEWAPPAPVEGEI